jgi:hypothetical protein
MLILATLVLDKNLDRSSMEPGFLPVYLSSVLATATPDNIFSRWLR